MGSPGNAGSTKPGEASARPGGREAPAEGGAGAGRALRARPVPVEPLHYGEGARLRHGQAADGIGLPPLRPVRLRPTLVPVPERPAMTDAPFRPFDSHLDEAAALRLLRQ